MQLISILLLALGASHASAFVLGTGAADEFSTVEKRSPTNALDVLTAAEATFHHAPTANPAPKPLFLNPHTLGNPKHTSTYPHPTAKPAPSTPKPEAKPSPKSALCYDSYWNKLVKCEK